MRRVAGFAVLAALASLAGAQPRSGAKVAAAPQAPPGGQVTGKVTVSELDGKPVTAADVIVYVVGFTEQSNNVTATIQQKGRKFIPDLVAITAGDSVAFPNGDPFLHNVFSQSPPRKFDLGSFKKGESKEKQFQTPGVVDVYCNIHPEMAATILVLPNQKHVRTDPAGRFTLANVPPGDWTVFAYTRRAPKPVSAKVSVKSGGETTVELALVRGTEPPHANKYGEKYQHGTTTYK